MTEAEIARPIIGIENRTPQEVFDIMADRIRIAHTAGDVEPVAFMYVSAGNLVRFHHSPRPGLTAIGYTETKLYAHPPAQAPTDAEERTRCPHGYLYEGTCPRCGGRIDEWASPKALGDVGLREAAIAIICKEAEELGYCNEDVAEFHAGRFDGDDLLTLQAVERALSRTISKMETVASRPEAGGKEAT